ncbi:MAG: type 1 glutamine amidotransferase [Proteobacteria bacterium]|nr:type 1 glutamine amidotransferase [Pseudomonadota bacterium]
MAAPRLLVIDGNVAEIRARQRAALGYDSGDGYVRTLRRLEPSAECDVLRPGDGPAPLPAGTALEDYDGAVMTGSALNVYDGGAPIERQIELTRAVLAAGVPFFGSCWGLQIAVTAAGGVVHKNPLGREFGFARRIALAPAGLAHALYAGKPAVFEAPTIHRDSVAALPAGAVPLAHNDMGLQAASFVAGRATVWGVQYHPEYDYLDIAAAAERYGTTLVREGLFTDEAALGEFARELRGLAAEPGNTALAWKHGLGAAMTDARLRLREIRNWLDVLVLPRRRRRA